MDLLQLVIGAALGAMGTVLVEHYRDRRARSAKLRSTAENQAIEAFDATTVMVQEFRLIFAYNHDGTDDEADERQAAQFERFDSAQKGLRRLLPRMRLSADAEVVELLEQADRAVTEYFLNATEGRALVAEFGPAIERAEACLDRLEQILRTALRGQRPYRRRAS